jgi:uncharacterized protein YukE
MHPLFPYLLGTLLIVAFVGLTFAVSSALAFRDRVDAWQASAEARFVRALEKAQDEISAVAALAADLDRDVAARNLAIERQANELRQHRLSLPPPAMFAAPRRPVETSADWDDGDARVTTVRPYGPPSLPSF